MLTLLSLVTCVCVHWGLNPTIGSRALLFFFPSIIHLSLLSRFHLIHYWRRNATRVWIKRPIFFCLLTTRDDRTKKKRRHRSILGPTPWRKKLSIRLFIFDSSSRWFFFLFSPTFLFSRLFFLPGAFYWNGCIYTRAWESKQEASLLLILSSSWPFLVETAEKKRKKNGRIRDGWKVKGERGRDKGIKSLGIWEELFQNAPQSSSPSSSSCAALQVSGRERSITK